MYGEERRAKGRLKKKGMQTENEKRTKKKEEEMQEEEEEMQKD